MNGQKALPDSLELLRYGQVVYAEVRSIDVDRPVRRAAEWMAAAVARKLGIPAPTVRWFADRDDSAWSLRAEQIVGPIGCRAFYAPEMPGYIWIRAADGLTVDDAAMIAAHEVRHRWQHKRGGLAMAVTYRHEPGLYETDANAFMEDLINEHYGEWRKP